MGTEADSSHISMPELSSLLEWDESLKDVPDMQIFLSYDFYAINNSHFYRSGYEYDEGSCYPLLLKVPKVLILFF